MYLYLLKQLEECVETKEGNNWNITLCSDGSGELIHPNGEALHVFNNEQELIIYVKSICKCTDSILTFGKCMELIQEGWEEISDIDVAECG